MANPNCPAEGTVEATSIPFSKLKSLHVGNTSANVEPSKLERLLQLARNLKSMGLYHCDLRSLPHGMRHLSSLRELNICNCQGSLPKWIRNFSSFETLMLSYYSKLTHLPSEMRNLPRLKVLKIINYLALNERSIIDGIFQSLFGRWGM
ncbi:hypothetical protein BT93_H3315 [Corymbia citriodora subsp. variegata]|nr:hypothetical protein BT93_H3315 [Corymbia citriodora subsp. variegata]